MALQSELVRQELLESNEEFRRLAGDHALYDQQLEVLLDKENRSTEEEVEITRLKKLKLQKKDQMEKMIQAYRREQSEAVEAT